MELAGIAGAADPNSWRAATLMADLSFDKAEFLYGQKADLSEYAGLREDAFNGYKKAVGLYSDALAQGKIQPSARAYFQWFSSSMGASDLGVLTRQDKPDLDQVAKVSSAITTLPQTQTSRHIGLFAKEVTTAMNTLAPELKVRFLTNAARVIG